MLPPDYSNGNCDSNSDTSSTPILDGRRRTILTTMGVGVAGLLGGGERVLAALSLTPTPDASNRIRPTQGPQIIPPPGPRSVMEKSLSRAGAVGNGQADDTDAIQTAISEVERNTRFESDASNTPFLGAGEVFWPQGLFLISNTIRIRRSIRLRGEGQAEYSSGARIQQERSGMDLFLVDPIAQGCSIGLNNLTLRANGGGGSGGSLLKIVKKEGQCNSIRIIETVFATPQTYAIDITHGDDILIDRCLFDASGQECIRLGQREVNGQVSNVRITRSNFYAIASECIVLGNANSVVIESNNVLAARATRTFVRVRGDLRQARVITVRGNTLKGVNCAVDVTDVSALIVDANNGEQIGGGVTPRRAAITCAGACAGVTITGNRMSGDGALGLYDDTAASVTDAVIVANSFVGTSGENTALRVTNTRGRIGDNHISGTPPPGVGYRWSMAYNFGTLGLIQPHSSSTLSIAVPSAIAADNVTIATDQNLPKAIMISGRAKVGAIDIHYFNSTPWPTEIPAHVFAVTITR